MRHEEIDGGQPSQGLPVQVYTGRVINEHVVWFDTTCAELHMQHGDAFVAVEIPDAETGRQVEPGWYMFTRIRYADPPHGEALCTIVQVSPESLTA